MGIRDVYQRRAIDPARREQIKRFTAESQRQVYQGTMRRELARLGYGTPPLTLRDPAALAAIDAKASELAESIISTYNRMLAEQLADLPGTATDEELIAGLRPFDLAVNQWNHTVLIPYTTRWTRQLAIEQLHAWNDFGTVQWEVVGPPPVERICQDAMASSPMSAEAAAAIEMPAHRRCPHVKRPIVPPGQFKPVFADLRFGQ